MAGYDYGYRPGYSDGKGARSDGNGWNKTGYTDEECRTVIVDADGTQRIITGCAPLLKPGSYVTKTETIIRVPPAYKHSSPPTTYEPVKEYRYAGDKWHRPSSPVKSYGYAADDHKLHRPSSPVKGYGYASDDHELHRPSSPVKSYVYASDDHKLHRPSSPVKSYGYASDDHKLHNTPVKGYGYASDDHKLRRPSSPVKGYGYASDDHKIRRPSSPEYDYPHEVGDFLSKVQIGASRDQPSRIGPFNGVNRRQSPQQTGHPAGYGDYSDYNNKPLLYKPNGNTIRGEIYDDYHHKNDSDMISNGSHQARPIPSIWVPPPGRDEGRLTSATNDIETALRILKESAKSSSSKTTMPQYSNYSAVPKQDEYSRKAEKRHGRFN